MASVLSANEVKRKQLQVQENDLAEFAEKIKRMFQDADPKGTGTIGNAALMQVFRELDSSWTSEDLSDMLALVGGEGSDSVNYLQFVDWFMEEEDPKLRKQLWQNLSNAFSSAEANEQDDPEDSDEEAARVLEEEEELEDLDIDLDELISQNVWQGIVVRLDIDEDEGQEIYEEVMEEVAEQGREDTGKGFPLKDYLHAMKVELDDREGLVAVSEALEDTKKQIALNRSSTVGSRPNSDPDKPAVRTMFDKVVRALDKMQAPAEEGWQYVEQGKVVLSKVEREAAERYRGRERKFNERVKTFMVSPPLVTATSGQTAISQRCIAEVNEIIKRYEETGEKFLDPEWNVKTASKEVLYVDKKAPGYDCTVGKPARWRRLTDIVNVASPTTSALGSLFGGFSGGGGPKKKKRPVLFKGGIKAGDIVQGNIGTCFLLGAMGAIASNNPEAVQKMFIKFDVDAGVYGVRFNLDGEWTYVIIDDYLPVDYDGSLLYAHCNDAEEVWVPLLEKAFCKLHTCFEMCDGGASSEAIACMFGGAGQKFKVKAAHRRNPGSYFKILKQARAKGWLLTTGFQPRGRAVAGAGKCGEAVLPTGLVGGHAYSVLRLVEAHGHQLVCCRNPWGTGEWTGKWSDENAEDEWTMEMKASTGYRGKNDGRFWMSIEDFVANTAGVDYARTFGPKWYKLSQYKRFQRKPMVAVASYDYDARDRNEISFKEGDSVKVSSFTGDWWWGNVKGRSEQGFFPGNYVSIQDRPVSCFELVGTVKEGVESMTAVVLIMQPKAEIKRRWFVRKEDKMNYKDLSYPCLELVVVGPDGKSRLRKEGKRRCLWGELKLPGGGHWRIYGLSSDGQGDAFTLRVYVKDGTATLREIPGAQVQDVLKAFT